MIKRKKIFRLVEGDFDLWIFLGDKIDQICKDHDGRCFDRSFNSVARTCSCKIEFNDLASQDNAIIKVIKLIHDNGLEEEVIFSEDLVLKELAEAAGVA
tara:strand:+ start:26734 stop:27030 length:297 start_codon:yes stop_codon:yes gene_type:complete